MTDFWNLLFSGTVISLPSIIAAIGIVINNNRASARQKTDRKIKMKVELLERIYGNFDDISDNFILIMASLEKRLFEIREEILKSGTENKLQCYVLEMNELAKKAVFLAVHKRKILGTYGIKVDADELAKYIGEVTKKVVTYTDIVAFVTRLYVVKYHDMADKSLVDQAVIQELKSEKERNELYSQGEDEMSIYLQNIDNQRRKMVEDYNRAISTLDESEKRYISARVSSVVRAYIDDLNKYGTEPFDQFEEQLVLAIKKLVK